MTIPVNVWVRAIYVGGRTLNLRFDGTVWRDWNNHEQPAPAGWVPMVLADAPGERGERVS